MDSDTVVLIFDRLFSARYKTHLISGAEEPYYLFEPEGYSKIFFRCDYVSSAFTRSPIGVLLVPSVGERMIMILLHCGSQ